MRSRFGSKVLMVCSFKALSPRGWLGIDCIFERIGGPGHTNFASFSAAVIVVGGSGITFGLSVIKDLVEKDLKGKSRVKAIELIWSVPEPCKATSFSKR